ncbi:MAG TPA: outer-membrane lipoprotein carrier protein LolA [Rhizomicrobium sp.]|jgi:outer membrane lipoprotein-sorting protein|nr:outer-membrane lipoprotein carrier protein LolA [Rhizomicrobium sp.]
MRRSVFALLVLLAAPMLTGASHPAPPHRPALDDADRATLDAISARLNELATVKGEFTQINPDGSTSEGTFFISKPGKMRFEYKPPTPTLIVADGKTVAVANTKLNTVDRYPLSETPLGLVLGNEVDLKNDTAVVDVEHQQGSIVVGARTNANMSRANISLVFSDPGYELRQWTVIDNQGLTTTVALRDLVAGAPLSPSLFLLPDRNPFARHTQE